MRPRIAARAAALPALPALLAVLALPALPAARPPRVEPFAGAAQPDAGTRIAASRNGQAVVFESSVRESGDRWDPAADPTVLLWERRTGALRQLTASAADSPAVANGDFYLLVGTSTTRERRTRTLVAFRSRANLAGRNADGSAEIFLWDSKTSGFTQISDALAGESSDPALAANFTAEKDANGRYTGNILVRYRVAFLSTSDLTGDNPGGLPQVFSYDSGMPEVGRLVQASRSSGGAAGRPSLDGNGDRVVFTHTADLLPGEGGAGATEVYAWDRRTGLRRVSSGGSAGDRDPVLDSTGRWAAWVSESDGESVLPGAGIPWIADLRRGRASPVAGACGAAARAPSLARGRRRLLFLDAGAIGDDPCGDPEERPLLLDGRGRLRETGLAGPGAFGPPVLLDRRPREFLVTCDGDLDGSNAAGRNVLWISRLP